VGPLICCLDDSEGARHALHFARALADRLELELVLLHVEPPVEAPGVSAAPAGQRRLQEEELRDAESLLSALAAEADLDPSVRTRAAVGNASDRIVAICVEEGASLVVLGSRGRGGLKSALLGSVSSAVAAKAPCACVIVPPTAADHLAFE
jgi:nucleotide-binding universal stress UspA family protein